MYPAGSFEEFLDKLQRIKDKEDKAMKQVEEEERKGDEFAAKLESDDPVANHGLCKERIGLQTRQTRDPAKDITGRHWIYRPFSGEEIRVGRVHPEPPRNSTTKFLEGICKFRFTLISFHQLILLIADRSLQMPLSYEKLLDGMRIVRAQRPPKRKYSSVLQKFVTFIEAKNRVAECSKNLDDVVAYHAKHRKYLQEFKRKELSDLKRNLS